MPNLTFRAERDTLLDALANAGRAATRTGGYALPVLGGIHIATDDARNGILRLTGTDLELTILADRTVAVDQPGTAVLPARLTADIVRSLEPGVVTVTTDDGLGSATIAGGRSDFQVRMLPADEYPKLTVLDGAPVTIPAADFTDALAQVTPAASRDDARPILTGILFEQNDSHLRLVSTDSYRLAVREVTAVADLVGAQSRLIPSRSLIELLALAKRTKADTIGVTLGDRQVDFTVGDHDRLSTVLIEGEFPNYRGLVPTSQPFHLTVNREALIEAVKRVALLAREATPVRFELSDQGVTLRATTQDVGNAAEPVGGTYDGHDLTVAFNAVYLQAGLESIETEEVTIGLVDALKPALIRGVGDETFTYLLMPVRVS